MSARTAGQIDGEAADWAARLDRGLSAEEDHALDAWLASDARCPGAFARVQALALSTLRARALGPDFDPADFVPPQTGSRSSRRHVLRIGGAIAASLLIGGTAAWRVLDNRGRFRTGKGETKVVALKDGSVVTLNTASEIRVRYSDTVRTVELVSGEALFDVAKSTQRPFLVSAGDTNVRVVGTSFTVRRLEAAPVRVLVRNGVVDVYKLSAGGRPVRIFANDMAESLQGEAGTIAARPVAVAQLRREMAWQNGQIAFEGDTLAQAAAQFSRYSDIRIVIEDPALAREEIAGLFKASDPIGFAQTIAVSLNAHARIGEGEVRIGR